MKKMKLLLLLLPVGNGISRIRVGFILLFFFIIIFSTVGSSCSRISSNHYISVSLHKRSDAVEGGDGIGMEVVNPTGSSIPDCTHACGACYPCKRVMVGFKCSVAESCPVVYKCTCKGKYYHVPSN